MLNCSVLPKKKGSHAVRPVLRSKAKEEAQPPKTACRSAVSITLALMGNQSLVLQQVKQATEQFCAQLFVNMAIQL